MGGDSKAILLINKRDGHSEEIPIRTLMDKYPIAGFYSFSIQDDKAELQAFRETIAQYITNNPSWNRQTIAANYFSVKQEVEELFASQDVEHVCKEDIEKIANKHSIESFKDLLQNLNALGIALWYPELEDYDTLVLNPEWISHGVYAIINWMNNEKKHDLSIDEMQTVFAGKEARYPTEKHPFLYKLMLHYKLAYETKEKNSTKKLIVPHLLKKDRPESPPEFNVGESLMLRYEAGLPLPPNTISLFIIQHNQQIKKANNNYFVWRYGVVLEDGKGSIALVKEDDRVISVSVKGSKKTEFISELRDTLNDIFNTYKSEKPELQYRIVRFGQIPEELEQKEPIWLGEKKVVSHVIAGVPYFDDATLQTMSLERTINVYNINTLHVDKWASGQDNKIDDHSIHNTFTFKDCNINLQGSLNELANELKEEGKPEEAKSLEKVASLLEKAEEKTPEEAKKKGIGNALKRLMDEINDEKSTLNGAIKAVKSGASIAQDIAKSYNSIAQWLGMQ